MNRPLLALLLIACDPRGEVQTLQAVLKLDIETVEFGNTEVGATAKKKVIIKNEGRRDLTFANATLTGHDAFVFLPLPEKLGASEEHIWQIEFQPGRVGAFSAQLAFTTNDKTKPLVTLAMAGNGVDPNAMVCAPPFDVFSVNCKSDRVLDFGQVLEKLEKKSAISVDAISRNPVEIIGFGLDDVQKPACAAAVPDAQIFKVLGGPVSLAPGEGVRVPLAFAPPCADATAYAATLRIDGPDAPIATVALGGTGIVDCARHEETHEQRPAGANKVDILFVIDDRPSMSPLHQKIFDNAEVFLNALINEGADFHVGITTTDPNRAGELIATNGGVRVVTSALADPVATFREITNKIGTMGWTDEYGFGVVRWALTHSSRTYAPSNFASHAGTADFTFLRANAALYAIIVSDSDDATENVATAALSLKTLEGLLGAPGVPSSFKQAMRDDPAKNFGVYAIVEPQRMSSSCGLLESLDGTPVYHQGIDALGTSGAIVSICSDFGATLASLGSTIAKPHCSFAVKEAPPTLAESFELCVEGGVCFDSVDVSYAGVGAGAPNGTISIAAAVCPPGGETFRFTYGACLRANDADGDGICDALDNCDSDVNPQQEDDNEDGVGNACSL